jgi:hypothetical protein
MNVPEINLKVLDDIFLQSGNIIGPRRRILSYRTRKKPQNLSIKKAAWMLTECERGVG